jgi:hypothetical protein
LDDHQPCPAQDICSNSSNTSKDGINEVHLDVKIPVRAKAEPVNSSKTESNNT